MSRDLKMSIFAPLKTSIAKLIAPLAICLAIVPNIANANVLKSSAIEVNANVILLGDIFNVGVLRAREELFQAPPLGRKGILTAKILTDIAEKYSIDWHATANFQRVTVSRKSKTIDNAEIKNIIRNYAADNNHINRITELTKVKLYNNFKTLIMPASDFPSFNVSEFDYRPFNDQFTVTFRYINQGNPKTIQISGKIENLVRIPVFANNIRRNQQILQSDIKYIQVNTRRLPDNIVLHIEDIIGKSAKNSIRAMQPIAEHLLKYPDLVKKNTIINLAFNQGRIQLNIKARALTTGANGALIKVMNLKSGKQIDAIVTGIDQAMTLNSNRRNARLITALK